MHSRVIHRALAAVAVFVLWGLGPLGCSDDGSTVNADTDGPSETSSDTGAGSGDTQGSQGDTDDADSNASGSASDTGDGTSSDSGETGVTTEGTTGGEPEDLPVPSALPTPTGTCPEFAAGDVTFSPAGTDPRSVRIWMSDAAYTMDGPLVFYWHGTGSNPGEALFGLNSGFVDEVVAQGGIVVAPSADPAAGQFPWFLTAGTQEFDLLVADEVLACAVENVGIDTRRIHSIGMSAGGLHTAQFSYRRSSYLASVVLYSGGFFGAAPTDQDPGNPLSAMIFHGGPSDVVVISFQDASESYLAQLQNDGRFGFICDHGNGHTIPPEQGSVWRFFADHPYGTSPSPYESGLPEGFPGYCSL